MLKYLDIIYQIDNIYHLISITLLYIMTQLLSLSTVQVALHDDCIIIIKTA